MPLYQLECEKCQHSFESYLVSYRSPNTPCTKCEGATERIWQDVQRGATSIFPYVTNHITGKPIEIKSASHLRSLEKRHGVRLRDDNAFQDKTYGGVDWKTGKQIYREGSGRGLPGSWF